MLCLVLTQALCVALQGVVGEAAEMGGVVVDGGATKSDPSGHVPSFMSVMVEAGRQCTGAGVVSCDNLEA